MSKSPRQTLRRFGLTSLFWLPLSFFVWYSWSSLLLLPVSRLSERVLTAVWGDTFYGLEQIGSRFVVEIFALSEDGRTAVLAFELNPLIYGYGLPLLIGMILAVPQSSRRQLVLLALGYVLMLGVWLWGVVMDSLKTVLFDFPEQMQGLTLVRPEINLELVALGYQLGYLILPGVVPVAFWLGTHGAFIEQITGRSLSPPRKSATDSSD